jgi:hypothetical protein
MIFRRNRSAMPILSLIKQDNISPDLTPILTKAFDEAWEKFKSSGSALAEEGCAPSTRALLAKRIIESAQKGKKDVNSLVEDGMRYLSELK